MLRTLALISALLFAAPVAADEQAIEDVISKQLQAFNDRDVEGAWEYASPMIKGIFQSPDRFGMMVQNGYPMVWDNAEAQYLELREIDGRLWQRVQIRGPQGALWILEYQMIETADGWQINGVQVLPAPDVGV